MKLFSRTLSRRMLAVLSAAVLAAMLLPLVIACFYSYPADDDFGFNWKSAEIWADTGSLGAVLQNVGQSIAEMYTGWQGTFATVAYFCLNPIIFGVKWCVLSYLFLLAALCLSCAYLLKTILRTFFPAADGVSFLAAYTTWMALVLQLMPCIGEVIYWHTGGSYALCFCCLALLFGLLIRFGDPRQSAARRCWRYAALTVCGLMVGGGMYPIALSGALAVALYAAYSLRTRRRGRGAAVYAAALVIAAFLVNYLAPGNAVRQARVGAPGNPVAAVAQSVVLSIEYAGQWSGLPMLAATLVLIPLLWDAVKQSECRFSHPFWFFVFTYGVYASSFTPEAYAMGAVSEGRTLDATFLLFMTFAMVNGFYLTGWLVRTLESRGSARAKCALQAAGSARLRVGTLAVAALMFFFGLAADALMTKPSIAAARGFLTGEMQQFHAEMLAREAAMTASEDIDQMEIGMLSVAPCYYKADKLPLQGIYGRRRYMKWYYDKQAEVRERAQ